ncbi:hypothetical protein ACGK9U_10145 [Mariniflexile sp. HNIBRBA6329]|uniref:hypothetical protein n=1 Tax=Mariniflexile sp. HNIBRBA6329 TaxID=3373088 RepID=UPI00374694F6
MKQVRLFLILVLSTFHLGFAQQPEAPKPEKTSGIFYKFSLATSLTINGDYTIGNDEEETFFESSALFVNNTVGYQFDKRTSIGLNFEYNWHSKQGLHFFPAYLSLQHNVIAKDTNLFIRGGYGTLLGMGKSFEKGNMYKLGIGFQGDIDDKNNSILIGLDFTRKRFGYKTLEGLSSVTIFLEFMLF